jgi:hypothetical protein
LEFGEDLCKLLIAIHAPWNAVNNPQMQLFVQKWVPGAVVPNQQTLLGSILDQKATKNEEKLKYCCCGLSWSFSKKLDIKSTKIYKILNIFEHIDLPKSWWVLCKH